MSLPQHRQEGLVRSQCSLSNTHTHSNTHWRRSCPFVMSFIFFQPPPWKSLLSFGFTSRRWPLRAGKNHHRTGKILLQAWPPFESVPIECFCDSRRSTPTPPTPWEMIILIKVHDLQWPRWVNTRRRSSHFHNNQHGTFRPKYINAQNEHIAGKWTVIVLCYFWTATQVSLGHVNILLTMLCLCSNVFTILFSFFVMCVLGLKKPLLTFADKWTALFEDIKGSAMFAQRRKCPLLFALDDAQVMNISPQIYIKVSFQMEGLGKSIWIPSMTIPSPSELNLRGGHLCLLPEALIGPSSLFTTKFCSTYVTETRQN